jgi:O-antigen/teichoic acid export membrane protein
VIAATTLAGIVDMGLAWMLIPRYGAVGACIANGAAQFSAVGLMWGIAIVLFKVRLPWMLTAKVALISIAAGLAGHFCARNLPPLWAVLAGGVVSFAVLFGLFYLFRILQEEDRDRLTQIVSMLPRLLQGLARAAILVLIRAGKQPLTATHAELP